MNKIVRSILWFSVLWSLVFFGFGTLDIAFCRWIYYGFCSLGVIVTILLFIFLLLMNTSYVTKKNISSTKKSIDEQSSIAIPFSILNHIGMCAFIYNTPHVLAFNIISFVLVCFYASYFAMRSAVKKVTVDEKLSA